MTSAGSRSGICKDSKKDKIGRVRYTQMRVSTREPGSGTQTHDGDHLKCFCKDSAVVCFGTPMSVACEAQQKFGQSFEPMSAIGTSDEYCTSIPSKTGLQSVPRDHTDTTEPEVRPSPCRGGAGGSWQHGGATAGRPTCLNKPQQFSSPAKTGDNFGVVLGVLEHT